MPVCQLSSLRVRRNKTDRFAEKPTFIDPPHPVPARRHAKSPHSLQRLCSSHRPHREPVSGIRAFEGGSLRDGVDERKKRLREEVCRGMRDVT
jgi:hypothetical protein